MIYLDNNATTPVLPEVLHAMQPYFCEEWGNPASSYRFGARVRSVVEEAREKVAALMGAHVDEIVFTGCATESNNAAFRAALKTQPTKRHIVTSAVEHASVLSICQDLERGGYRVTYLPVDRQGQLKASDVENAISEQTALVSLMWANNETGVLFPVQRIADICRSRNVLYHCDAVQVAGKIQMNAMQVQPDYLSITGHKFHAPKGIGALYVRRKAPFTPLLLGGHQERSRRGGTENVPFIVALGTAAELALSGLPRYDEDVRPLRDCLETAILRSVPEASINGDKLMRIANTTNITFFGCNSDALLLLLDEEGICASAGSACLADSAAPSHVIAAMKGEASLERDAVRFSLSKYSTLEEVRNAAQSIVHCFQILKKMGNPEAD